MQNSVLPHLELEESLRATDCIYPRYAQTHVIAADLVGRADLQYHKMRQSATGSWIAALLVGHNSSTPAKATMLRCNTAQAGYPGMIMALDLHIHLLR